MSGPAPTAPYTLRSIEQMLGLSRSVILGLVQAGFVKPVRGPRNEYRFSFQDVVLLRTAHHLRSAKVPPRRLLRSLKQLRSQLPAALPMSGLRITAIGSDVAVRDGGAPWAAESGQLLMDFDPASVSASLSVLQNSEQAPVTAASASMLFEHGAACESDDKGAAEAAYRQALAIAPDHTDAYLNLGAMMCEDGRCAEAVALYDQALLHCPDQALLHFNRAVALEDLQREAEALAAYDRCLALDPQVADAHYNAGRLHEQLGQTQRALRHYSAYRRLMP